MWDCVHVRVKFTRIGAMLHIEILRKRDAALRVTRARGSVLYVCNEKIRARVREPIGMKFVEVVLAMQKTSSVIFNVLDRVHNLIDELIRKTWNYPLGFRESSL